MKKLTFAKVINLSLAVMLAVALFQAAQLSQMRRDVAVHTEQIQQIAQERAVISAELPMAPVDKLL